MAALTRLRVDLGSGKVEAAASPPAAPTSFHDQPFLRRQAPPLRLHCLQSIDRHKPASSRSLASESKVAP